MTLKNILFSNNLLANSRINILLGGLIIVDINHLYSLSFLSF